MPVVIGRLFRDVWYENIKTLATDLKEIIDSVHLIWTREQLKKMLRLQATTSRLPTKSPLLALPQEILSSTLFPYLQPRSVWRISVLCLGMRITVATATEYWKNILRQSILPTRTTDSVPFYDWINKECSYSLVSTSWNLLKSNGCLSELQRSSLLPPTSLKVIIKIEKKMNVRFPIDVVISLTKFHNGQSTTRRQGSQFTGDFFMIPITDMPLIQKTQFERGFKKEFIPLFVDSSHQKLICYDLNCTEICMWSPLTRHFCAKRWSTFLKPE